MTAKRTETKKKRKTYKENYDDVEMNSIDRSIRRTSTLLFQIPDTNRFSCTVVLYPKTLTQN